MLASMQVAIWAWVLMAKVARLVFVLEIAFSGIFYLITSAPLLSHFAFLNPSSRVLGFIVVGGYLALGAGFLIYVIGAISAISSRVTEFWKGYSPPIAGLPILIWGSGKLNSVAGLTITTAGVLVSVLFAILLVKHTAALRVRVLPLVLLAACIAVADQPTGFLLHLPVGALLLVAPVVFATRSKRRNGAKSCPLPSASTERPPTTR